MSVLLYSGETWAVVKQHISPLAVSQMNCLRCICGIPLRDHVSSMDILSRCNTPSVESRLQGKRLKWLGHVFRMPNDSLPEKLLFGQVEGHRPPERPRSSFNDVALHVSKLSDWWDLMEMRKTDSFGNTRLLTNVPSSS